jgi:predicted NBD/HSP70 family sugar kinase
MSMAGGWVGIGPSILVNVFNPERTVLGGLFAKVYPCIAERIGWELDRRALQAALAGAQLLPAALGADSALIGAAELVLPCHRRGWGYPE